jgi:creatinine amidohydrolase/Fe(II)-dependent formamide hydrolase-like protein
VVAPVVAYVPEGSIDPASQHMRWPGTITVPEPAFEALLTAAARSLHKHGFCHVVLLGDHGGYRASLDRVVAAVGKEWARQSSCRVHALPEFYRASQGDFAAWLRGRGFSAEEIGTHAGLADTALALAVDPGLVRLDVAAARPRGAANDGVAGDPRRATAELGRAGIDHIVDVSVAAIRAATKAAQ